MPDSARYALHRPELYESLQRGEQKITALMAGSAQAGSAGEVLITANTDHEYVYRLVRGWAGRIRSLGDGRDQCILIFLPGDLFAVKSMFTARHPDEVRFLSPSLIERTHHRHLLREYAKDADIANRCTWQVIEEERRLHNWVVGLGQGRAHERLAMLLIEFRGRLALSGTITSEALTFEMPLTQVQLADHLGMTAIHLNRMLRSLREEGIARVSDGEVTILDRARLRQLAMPLLDPYERTTSEFMASPTPGGSSEDAPAAQ
jgi:CRP-like cAMP-binding protein